MHYYQTFTIITLVQNRFISKFIELVGKTGLQLEYDLICRLKLIA